MDDTTLRILDALSRNLGRPTSIRGLTQEIKDLHGTAYYANIYRSIQGLAREGVIQVARGGRSSLVSLDFRNYMTLDLLTEVELVRKMEFLRARKEWRLLLAETEERLRSLPGTGPACLVDPERNARLNRAELLVLRSAPASGSRDSSGRLRDGLSDLEKRHSVRLDALALGEGRMLELLRSADRNPVQEMLANKIAFHAPHEFWAAIRGGVTQGFGLRFEGTPTHPAKIPERDLAYNLLRFGYRELGTKVEAGEDLCLEVLVTAVLMQRDARRIAAIPALLAKNRADYDLLVFLARKHGVADRLLGLLRASTKILPDRAAEDAAESLVRLGAKEVRADRAGIEQRMRLYSVLG